MEYGYPSDIEQQVINRINERLGSKIKGDFYCGELWDDESIKNLAGRVAAYPLALVSAANIADVTEEKTTTQRRTTDLIHLTIFVCTSNKRNQVEQHRRGIRNAQLVKATIAGAPVNPENSSRSFITVGDITIQVQTPELIAYSVDAWTETIHDNTKDII